MEKVLIPKKVASYKVAQKLRRKQLNEGIRQEDLIDRYLMGKMTPEEEISFFQELEENPDFKQRAIAMAWMVKSLRK